MLKKCNCIIVFLCILLFCGCSKIEDIDLNINKSLIETNNDDSMLEETTIIKINTNMYDYSKNLQGMLLFTKPLFLGHFSELLKMTKGE